MPRQDTLLQLETEDTQGPNRGPQGEDHARAGPVHPNGVCGPWLTWTPALEAVFRPHDDTWREEMARRGMR